MIIQHLSHSGVLIETPDKQLFIDAIDHVASNIDYDKSVYFFVTHGHADHYDASICDFAKETVSYVLSDDIAVPSALSKPVMVQPDELYCVDDMTVRTFGSTDLGVSFLIELNGVIILHSGDLNWWHWQNDDEATQLKEAADFKAIVDRIPEHIDVAFVPYDPRLAGAEHYSFDYYLSTKRVRHIVPIHMRDNFSVSQRMFEQFPAHKDKLVVVQRENEVILEIDDLIHL